VAKSALEHAHATVGRVLDAVQLSAIGALEITTRADPSTFSQVPGSRASAIRPASSSSG
jgi:hypothetical protein